jgi:hypothetical protein
MVEHVIVALRNTNVKLVVRQSIRNPKMVQCQLEQMTGLLWGSNFIKGCEAKPEGKYLF